MCLLNCWFLLAIGLHVVDSTRRLVPNRTHFQNFTQVDQPFRHLIMPGRLLVPRSHRQPHQVTLVSWPPFRLACVHLQDSAEPDLSLRFWTSPTGSVSSNVPAALDRQLILPDMYWERKKYDCSNTGCARKTYSCKPATTILWRLELARLDYLFTNVEWLHSR